MNLYLAPARALCCASLLLLNSCVGTHQEAKLPDTHVAILKLVKMDSIDGKLPYNPMGVPRKQIKVTPGRHKVYWCGTDLASLMRGIPARYGSSQISFDMKAGHVYQMCYALFASVDGKRMTLDAATEKLKREPALSGIESEAIKIALFGRATPEQIRPVTTFKNPSQQTVWNKIVSTRIQFSLYYFAYDVTTGEVIDDKSDFYSYLKQRAVIQARGNYLQW